MSDNLPIELTNVSYSYGRGALKKQILFDIDVAVKPGEIVILTGPSGSGKTTLLTLMGALRATQEGSVRVLGQELKSARQKQLVRARRQIGYIFQSHNLLKSLTIRQNVQMAVNVAGKDRKQAGMPIDEILERVGLAEYGHKHPTALSGGQKQRAGIARALVNRPEIVLADEPTASLDKKSGRDVVELIQDLAREDGTAVVLVTHDNRILDIADRIVHLEDGRLRSTSEAVVENTSRMLNLLERHNPNMASYLAAFSSALARVAYADSKVVDSERDAVREILAETANLSPGEIEFIMEMSLMQSKSRLPFADTSQSTRAAEASIAEQRKNFLASLYKIANADGTICDEEIAEIKQIAAEFGLKEVGLKEFNLDGF